MFTLVKAALALERSQSPRGSKEEEPSRIGRSDILDRLDQFGESTFVPRGGVDAA